MVEGSFSGVENGSWNTHEAPVRNKSAISIANNSVQYDRTKHIEIDIYFFFIKEKLNSGLLQLGHVSIKD